MKCMIKAKVRTYMYIYTCIYIRVGIGYSQLDPDPDPGYKPSRLYPIPTIRVYLHIYEYMYV
jgi:hypothetical protein